MNDLLSGLTGGSYGTAFLSAGVGSLSSSLTGGILVSNNRSWYAISVVASGSLAAGITSSVMGGNFWEGFRMGAITATLNHLGDHAKSKYRIDGYLKQKGIDPEGEISAYYRTKRGILSLINKITPLGFDYIAAGEPGILVSDLEYGTTSDGRTGYAWHNANNHTITVFQAILNTNYRAFTLTLGHEIQHALHHHTGLFANWKNKMGIRWARIQTEIKAYQWNIDYTGGSIPKTWIPNQNYYSPKYWNFRSIQMDYINRQ